jgi:hypothetical protein
MTRALALATIRTAAYHGDQQTALRVWSESKLSMAALRKAIQDG